MRVGFIGLGMMGKGMAANLQKAGHQLVVHDLSRAADKRGAVAGATGGVEVEIVASDHQNPARRRGEKGGRPLIGFGSRLVESHYLAGHDGVPVDAISARDVDHQRQAQDRKRNTNIPPL